jgi:hypothetical protein
MEPFECSGVWWVADDPSARVAGVLRFAHEDGLVLNLLGTLGGGGGPVGAKTYAVILGSAYDSPFGQPVTLTGCRQTRYTIGSSGLSTEAYRAERAFFGGHLTTPEDFRFSNCNLGISGLSEWAAHRTGFRLEYGEPGDKGAWMFRLSYTPPPVLTAEIPGGTLELYINADSSQTLREQSFKEEVRFSITAAEPLTDGDWNGRYVYPLLNFLTLATDVPNALTGWELGDLKRPFKFVRAVGQRVFKGAANERGVTPHRMLFPLEGLEERFPALVARWLAVAETYRDACNIFFGLWYAPGAYLDMRLLGITQSLELYQARRLSRPPHPPPSPPPSILAALPPAAQEELSRWVAGLTVDTFRETLEQLAGEHQAILSLLSPRGIGKLVDQLMAFRNHALYRTPFPAPLEAYSHGLFLATETLSYLMKACFLVELGFSQDERLSFFQRNAMYGFVRDEWAKRWALLETTGGPPAV